MLFGMKILRPAEPHSGAPGRHCAFTLQPYRKIGSIRVGKLDTSIFYHGVMYNALNPGAHTLVQSTATLYDPAEKVKEYDPPDDAPPGFGVIEVHEDPPEGFSNMYIWSST